MNRTMTLNEIPDSQVIQLAQNWKEATDSGRSAPCVLDALVNAHGRENAGVCLRKIERLVARELLQSEGLASRAWPTAQGLDVLDRPDEPAEAAAAR